MSRCVKGVFILAAVLSCATARFIDIKVETDFKGWQNFHGKFYSDRLEADRRQQIFNSNREKIVSHNTQGASFKVSAAEDPFSNTASQCYKH